MPTTTISSKLSVRVPKDLSQWLDHEARDSNLSKSEVIVEALRDYQVKQDYLKALATSRDEETRLALAEAEDDANLVSSEEVFTSVRNIIETERNAAKK